MLRRRPLSAQDTPWPSLEYDQPRESQRANSQCPRCSASHSSKPCRRERWARRSATAWITAESDGCLDYILASFDPVGGRVWPLSWPRNAERVDVRAHVEKSCREGCQPTSTEDADGLYPRYRPAFPGAPPSRRLTHVGRLDRICYR